MATRTPRDPYDHIRSEPDSPAKEAFVITPSDSENLSISVRGLYIGVGGNLHVQMHGGANNVANPGANVVFVNVVAGTVIPIRVDTVMATSTSAGHIVGLY
jgi:hypothetical protein